MKLSRRVVAASLLSAVAVATPASADPGRIYKDATGSGVVVNPTISGGGSSLTICGFAHLYGNGPLLTTIAVTADGAETYGPLANPSVNPLAAVDHEEVVFGSDASACVWLPLHGGNNSTYVVEFVIVATGTLTLGGASQTECTGTVVRALDGPIFRLNPCETV